MSKILITGECDWHKSVQNVGVAV